MRTAQIGFISRAASGSHQDANQYAHIAMGSLSTAVLHSLQTAPMRTTPQRPHQIDPLMQLTSPRAALVAWQQSNFLAVLNGLLMPELSSPPQASRTHCYTRVSQLPSCAARVLLAVLNGLRSVFIVSAPPVFGRAVIRIAKKWQIPDP